ncbi:hypothetical protein P4B35_11605 [Pontiellaceae bacterium B12227]|nr:hypothetical protein [Pontiellaceae bacterium B12227]
MAKCKVMAFHRSTGLWNRHIQVRLEQIIGCRDEKLETELAEWQALYDDQFRKYPYEFDWQAFNRHGRELTAKIQAMALPCTELYYVESDDRDFFNPEGCRSSSSINTKDKGRIA